MSCHRSSREGGIAFVVAETLCPYVTVKYDFSFRYSPFELVQLTASLSQHCLHDFCLYRLLPNRKNKPTDSLFIGQFPALLEYRNTVKGRLLIVGDFRFCFDTPSNTYTSRLIGLLDAFSLTQAVIASTHKQGHVLDWVLYREDDDVL